MPLTTTSTLLGALTPSDCYVSLSAIVGLKAGDNIGITVGGTPESMKVLIVGPTATGPLLVYRGARGTNGRAHASGVATTYGVPSDYTPGVGATLAVDQDALDAFEAREYEEKLKKALEAREREDKRGREHPDQGLPPEPKPPTAEPKAESKSK